MPDFPIHSCQLPQGPRVSWRECGSGTPLVLLHGWSMSSVVFAEMAPMLADKYQVLCPDLPGHGDSDALTACSLESYASWLSAWAKTLNVVEFNLLGWSLGGQLALRFAIDSPTELDKLVLVATTPCFCQQEDWIHGLPDTQISLLQRNLDRAYEKTMGEFFNLQFAGEELSKERYRQIITFAVRPGKLPEKERAIEALTVLGQADLRNLLPEISARSLIVHGTLDLIIPLGAGKYLADNIAGASLLQLPGVGHAPFFSRPTDIAAEIQEFIG